MASQLRSALLLLALVGARDSPRRRVRSAAIDPPRRRRRGASVAATALAPPVHLVQRRTQQNHAHVSRLSDWTLRDARGPRSAWAASAGRLGAGGGPLGPGLPAPAEGQRAVPTTRRGRPAPRRSADRRQRACALARPRACSSARRLHPFLRSFPPLPHPCSHSPRRAQASPEAPPRSR